MLPYDKSVRRLGVFAFLVAFCEALSFYAASLYAYALTGSVLVVSVVMTAIADRRDGSAPCSAAPSPTGSTGGWWPPSAALAGALLLGTLALGADVVVLTVVMVLAVIAASPIRPVIGAALPNLVIEGDLRFANGYVQALRNAALTLAPVAAGLGVGVVRRARHLRHRRRLAAAVGGRCWSCVRGRFSGADRTGVADSPLAGFALIRRDRVLLAVVVIAGALSYLAAAYCSIADLPLAIDELGRGRDGLRPAGRRVGRRHDARRRRRAPRDAAAAASSARSRSRCSSRASRSRWSPFAPSIALAAIAFIAGGMMGGIGITADQVLVQERVADGVRGRVRAANDAMMAAAYSLSLGIGGFVVVALGRARHLPGGRAAA